MAVKRYVLPATVFAVLVFAFCCYVFWMVFGRLHGGNETIVAIVAQAGMFIPLAVVFGVTFAVAIYSDKPLRSPNYPRIEHLRIAGKYQGTAAEMGISPLHLRG